MALNKLKFNSLNVTPTAGKTVGFNSDADGLEATFSGGAMAFISKSTASSSSTISFTSGIDSTYKEYLFIFNNIHPGTDAVKFKFNLSIYSGSNYNVTKTATNFYAGHTEADATGFGYDSGLSPSSNLTYVGDWVTFDLPATHYLSSSLNGTYWMLTTNPPNPSGLHQGCHNQKHKHYTQCLPYTTFTPIVLESGVSYFDNFINFVNNFCKDCGTNILE